MSVENKKRTPLPLHLSAESMNKLIKITSIPLRIASIAAFALVLTAINGCKKDNVQSTIPNVTVDRIVSLSLPEFSALNGIGNSIILSGSNCGYKGIIVYRNSISDFYAYERACPFDPMDNAAILVVDSGLTNTVDRHCGSRFLLIDGGILNGPATAPMKSYRVDYDAGTQTLHIHN
jgi:nitrite reductase/ring-hydroxylating ferredoxin subunit